MYSFPFLKFFFNNTINFSNYPSTLRLADIMSVYRKVSQNEKYIYRLVVCSQTCQKFSQTLYMNKFLHFVQRHFADIKQAIRKE